MMLMPLFCTDSDAMEQNHVLLIVISFSPFIMLQYTIYMYNFFPTKLNCVSHVKLGFVTDLVPAVAHVYPLP